MTTTPSQRLSQLAPAGVIGLDRANAGDSSKFLTDIARNTVLARAGHKPPVTQSSLPPCPNDPTPIASSAAAAILERLLAATDAGLIDEWATLAQRRRLRVPDAIVPHLIDWWSRQPRRSEAIFAVMGERAHWLASLNPDWRKPVATTEIPPNADELWNTGATAERAALLTTIRRLDPSRALTLLQSTWSTDGADERSRFVHALNEGRSMADEPFLESALDDRSKMVRRAATALLIKIPGSRLKVRLSQLARTIITVEKRKNLLRRESVKITLTRPGAHDTAWERDGIEEQPPGGTGKRAWWARQILAGADISLWTELSGLDPEATLQAIDKDDLADALDALKQAAIESADQAWIAPITRAMLQVDPKQLHNLRALWTVLPPPEREPLLLEILEAPNVPADERLVLLASHEEPWSHQFSRAALKILNKNTTKRPDAWTMSTPLDAILRHISPTTAADFERTLAALFSNESANTLQKLTDRLRLRADMHKEFHA